MGIMLLHNSIPHSHDDVSHQQVSCFESEVSWCVMSWLENVFQLDFGQDHLQYFTVSSASDSTDQMQSSDHFFQGFNNPFLLTEVFHQRTDIINYSLPDYNSSVSNDVTSRGPPSIS